MKKVALLFAGVLLVLGAATGCGSSTGRADVPEGYVKEGESFLFDYPRNYENYFYNYCPSVRQADANTRYFYYCTNKESGKVVDCIGFRKAVKVNGDWYYSPETIVLEPGATGAWDEMHNCDPNVIKGEFSYNGETYPYLMSFLGCVTTDNQNNEVGLAVSKTPEGPWIKCDDINPFVPYVYDPDFPQVFQWGYGQTSAVSVDQKGRILFSITCGVPGNSQTDNDTYIRIGRWDLSDLNNPVCEFEERLPIKGITLWNQSSPAPCNNNGDFAYDPVNNRIYMICDALPLDFENTPTIVTSALYVGYMQDIEGGVMGDVFKNYNGTPWRKVDYVRPELTGFLKNHNGAIITDEYGWLYSQTEIEVSFASCYDVNLQREDLFSYRLKRYTFDLT